MKRIIALAGACVVMGLMIPMAGAAAGSKTTKAVSAQDKTFLKTSMEGDLFEVQGGKIARTKTQNAAVMRLADRLIADHTKSYNDTAALARRLGVSVPTTPSPSEVWELKMVLSLSGASFDQWYSSLEMYDHTQDIQETTDEIKDGSATAVRDDARTELPMLRHHLRLSVLAVKATK